MKDLLKEDTRFFDEKFFSGIFDWLPLPLLLAVCLHQSSFLH
jgi:hypothetical protein